MPFSTTIDNNILNHFLNKASWGIPTAIYVGLSSTTPGKDGTNVTEPTGGSYARIQITPAEFNSPASSTTHNNVEKAFATATADWLTGATLTHLVIYDAVTAGTFLGFKAITGGGKSVLSGDTAKIASGDFDLTIAGT